MSKTKTKSSLIHKQIVETILDNNEYEWEKGFPPDKMASDIFLVQYRTKTHLCMTFRIFRIDENGNKYWSNLNKKDKCDENITLWVRFINNDI